VIETIAIAGVGLIGGSFGLALRAAGFRGELLGVSSPATIEGALARKAIDRGVTLEEAARTADVIYLAQPIFRILDTLTALGPLVREETLITDAGSTKRAIAARARECLPTGFFLGGHPMAGKEARGVEVAEADLFVGRPYLLTADDPRVRNARITAEFVQLVQRTGALPRWLTAAEHDRLVAASSHAPQLVSTALAAALAARSDAGEVAAVAGPGLHDMTRLALSSYEIWRDILETNSGEIDAALAEVEDSIAGVRAALASSTMRQRFDEAASFAARLRGTRRDDSSGRSER